MSQSEYSSQLGRLVAAHRDGRLTADEGKRLNDLLATSAEARRYFAEHALLTSMLELELTAVAQADVAAMAPVESPDRDGVFHLLQTAWRYTIVFVSRQTLLSLSTAALVTPLLIAALIMWISPDENQIQVKRQTPAPSVKSTPVVSRLTGAVNCVWSPDSHGMFRGARLDRNDRLELEFGLAEITFASGAKVVIEGPTLLWIGGRNKATLERGRITATVPANARGFVIASPSLNIVDLGTSFGVHVQDPEQNADLLAVGATEVSVFEGVVETELLIGADAGQTQRVMEGQSQRVDKSGSQIMATDTQQAAAYVRQLAKDATPSRSVTAAFTNSNQLRLAGRDVLSAVNFYDSTPHHAYPNTNTQATGPIQGAPITNFDHQTTTTLDELTVVLPFAGDGRRQTGAGITGTGPDRRHAVELADSFTYWEFGTRGSLRYAFGPKHANREVEVQLIGGDAGWDGVMYVSMRGLLKGVLKGDGNPDTANLLTFNTKADGQGNLVLDITVVAGRYYGLAGALVTAEIPRPEPNASQPHQENSPLK